MINFYRFASPFILSGGENNTLKLLFSFHSSFAFFPKPKG